MRIQAKLALGSLFLALVGAGYACEDAGSPPVDYSTVLQTLTNNVAMPAHTAFAAKSDALVTAMQAVEAGADANSLATAQSAWRDARAAFRSGDAVHFGPIEDNGITARIDVAPANPSNVDALAGGTAPIDVQSVGAADAHAKGFLGLEYLLFPADALGKLQADPRRRTLARAIAEEIAASAHQLLDAWDPAKGGYANELINAGKTSKRYPTQRAAVDDFVGGVGYALELVVGVRLAEPLGLKGGGTPDPSLDPTRASDSIIADLGATIGGVKAVYGGGFESVIKTRNPAMDNNTVAELADCANKASAIAKPFSETLLNATPIVTGAYQSCKTLKTTWNTDLTSAIGATLKPGDNDGD